MSHLTRNLITLIVIGVIGVWASAAAALPPVYSPALSPAFRPVVTPVYPPIPVVRPPIPPTPTPPPPPPPPPIWQDRVLYCPDGSDGNHNCLIERRVLLRHCRIGTHWDDSADRCVADAIRR